MLPVDLYYEYLVLINDVKFTPREVDIIACVLNGRTARTIPSLLSIAPKTVSAHIENIRAKTGSPSRESLISFIEQSDKYSLIKNEYYASLLTQVLFERCLKELSKTLPPQLECLLIYKQERSGKAYRIHTLEQDLKLVGLKLETKMHKGNASLVQLIDGMDIQPMKYILYAATDLEDSSFHTSKLKAAEEFPVIQKAPLPLEKFIFLFLNKTVDESTLKCLEDIQYVDFSKSQSYYFSFFELLKIISPNKNLDKIISEFKKSSETKNNISINEIPQVSKNHLLKKDESVAQTIAPSQPSKYFTRKIIYGLGIFIFILFSLFLYRSTTKEKELSSNSSELKMQVRSDLLLPIQSTLLNRSEFMTQIDNKLKGPKGIHTVAIVGLGGAGKTILARQYARQQKENIIWEVNAKTRGDLNTSFENLGEALSQSIQEKKELKRIREIKDLAEREEQIIQFVKKYLKMVSNWLLIFDNVEKLGDIQKYLPQDPRIWGEGKIILTTQDLNLQHSNQIDHVLFIGELKPSEKLNLFSKIMSHGAHRAFTATELEEAKRFLEKIPPFPLDITLAAYYLKVASISYDKYLENIKINSDDFDRIQRNVIKEFGNYSKTRFSIVALSLKEIIADSKDFSDLFLFISLLNSQNIPRELLEEYKNNIVVDDFIYHLKKYSFIMSEPFSSGSALSFLSLHQSAQDIILAYLEQQLNLAKENPLLAQAAIALERYVGRVIEEEDFVNMKIMTGHLEKFLEHSNFITPLSNGFLESNLGYLYYFTNEDKSQTILEDALKILKEQNLTLLSPENRARLARSLLQIAIVYTELRWDKEAEELFHYILSIYQQEKLKNHADLAWVLTHVGNLQRRVGNYEKAEEYLEESYRLHTQYPLEEKRLARTLAYLGFVYRKLGHYQKALDVLEKSLSLYNTSSSADDFRRGWVLTQLGKVYSDIGDHAQAKENLERGFAIFKKHLPENHLNMGLALAYLGIYYRETGEYEQSRDYLEKSLKIYQKYSDDKHLRTGWVLFNLAKTYKILGKQEEAQKLFEKVLKIYSMYCEDENIKSANLLRDMTGIYMEQNLLEKASDAINRSLTILQKRHHVEVYKSLETLGDVYLKKSVVSFETGNKEEGVRLKNQALSSFQQALEIVDQNLPENSIHREKLCTKIKKI